MRNTKYHNVIAVLMLITFITITIGFISNLSTSETQGETVQALTSASTNTEIKQESNNDYIEKTNEIKSLLKYDEEELNESLAEDYNTELNTESKPELDEVKEVKEVNENHDKEDVKTITETEEKEEQPKEEIEKEAEEKTEEKVEVEEKVEEKIEEKVEAKLPVEELKKIGNSRQVIIVTGDYGNNNVNAKAYEKINNKWTTILSCAGFIGSKGFAVNKVEGDKKTPRGMFTLGTAFGRYDNPGTQMPYERTDTNDVWVDDSNSEFYNTWNYKDQNNSQWNSAENLYIAPYNYSLVINYNTSKRIPGKGSAIFMHVSAKPTAGCVGISESNMIKVLRWLDPSKNPVIIMSPESELNQY